MSGKRVCDISCEAMHEFALVLDKAGFNADLVQAIINSKGNKHAKAMYIAVTNGLTVGKLLFTTQTGIAVYDCGDYFRFTLPATDGTTGEDWIKRLGSNIGDCAKQVLRSPDFKPTSGVMTEVAVLKGMLFEDNDRVTKKIRAEADKRKLSKPNAELACLICDNFTNEEIGAMGLWYIVAMHKPINDSGGDPSLLHAHRSDGGRWLRAYYVRPAYRWNRDSGFAFAVSQVSSQH